ncbi:type II toxin-antitoxin system RelE/ParE family toxin [Luteimonas sp. BDR2-5]|uniref:type II toxin-antitoxin system RelE/ParE family toxin n=1 Tax=Proluteimonas luteida TaxID=2878685 RepID=UPI001E52781E|nr:type II toxin-antitoxin system RelE/ParE family toxin [Luteimonas sp. BDR2-5]MCD9029022.1 type II toxin-antitoxin system RelE/ParE family toxin [Luteimonas sp. BDR2-5]
MSQAPRRAGAGAEPRIERLQPWIAALVSALLHVLFAYLLMLSQPVIPTTPQGASAGSRMVVDFVGITPPQPVQAPVASPPPATSPAQAAPAASRVRTTRVMDAPDPAPPDAEQPAEALTRARSPQPAPRPAPTPPQPVQSQADPGQGRAQAAASPPTEQRPARVWGQPPGMLPEDAAPVNAGMQRTPRIGQGRGRDSASNQPSMEVGGYQVVYDTTSETRLREWRDEGVTELFIPLPGTRDYMVCPLETALRRESGNCRMLAPEDPEMANIRDSREVIGFHRVYRRGEVVWRGPGPYR